MDLFASEASLRWSGRSKEEFERNPWQPQDLVTIIRVQTSLADHKYPPGRVTGGRLTVKGPCHDFPHSQFIHDNKGRDSTLVTDRFMTDILQTSVFNFDPASSWQDGDKLTCMLFRMNRPQREFAPVDKGLFAIFCLVQRLADGQRDVYQRVGCGQGHVHPSGDGFEDWERRTVHIV